jgi:hypothetical protein
VASFPVKIGLGALTMALGFPMAISYMGTMTEASFMDLLKFLGS